MNTVFSSTSSIPSHKLKIEKLINARITSTKVLNEYEKNKKDVNTYTIISDLKYSRGWVDNVRLLSKEEFVLKLRQNLKK